MQEISPLYNSNITCPVCSRQIEVTKVRSKYIRLVSQDEDYCPHYEGTNPLLYEAWVCSHCGYAAHSTVFSEASVHDARMVHEKITPKWTSRSFSGERNLHQALDAYKIVLYNLQVREAQFSEFAKICLRIAWLYRYSGEWTDEHRYLTFAYNFYRQAYSGEHLGGHKPDEYTLMYIIGELARRLGFNEDALSWFGRVISASAKPGEKEKIQPRLLDETRELIFNIRKAIGKKDSEA